MKQGNVASVWLVSKNHFCNFNSSFSGDKTLNKRGSAHKDSLVVKQKCPMNRFAPGSQRSHSLKVFLGAFQNDISN